MGLFSNACMLNSTTYNWKYYFSIHFLTELYEYSFTTLPPFLSYPKKYLSFLPFYRHDKHSFFNTLNFFILSLKHPSKPWWVFNFSSFSSSEYQLRSSTCPSYLFFPFSIYVFHFKIIFYQFFEIFLRFILIRINFWYLLNPLKIPIYPTSCSLSLFILNTLSTVLF